MEDTDLSWRKSSYSGNGGANCVEAASVPGTVLIRDTSDRTGPMLTFTSAAWRRLVAQVKRSLAAKPLALHDRYPATEPDPTRSRP
jgi:Domain of unknown function (DUF397)